jgi:hypothetical protein
MNARYTYSEKAGVGGLTPSLATTFQSTYSDQQVFFRTLSVSIHAPNGENRNQQCSCRSHAIRRSHYGCKTEVLT